MAVSAAPSRWPRRLALAAILAASAWLRLRLAGMPLERDEGEYAYLGQLILRGEWPYLAAHNMKLPGIYYAYAAILGVLGETDVAIRTGLAVVNAATIVLVYALARRVADAGAVTAAATYAALSLSSAVLGFTANAEHFVLLPALGGLVLLAADSPSPRRLAAAGVLLGTGFVMKQHGAAFVACGAAWIALRGGGLRRVAAALAVFGAGAIAPFAVVCLVMLAGGAFASFWFWTVTYAGEYATMIDAATGLAELRRQLGAVVGAAPLAWLLAAGGLVACALGGHFVDSRARGRVLVLLAASAAAIVPGLRFTDHYFLLALPAVSVLAGIGAASIVAWAAARSASAARAAAVAVPLAVVAAALVHDRQAFFLRSPDETARALYGVNPLVEAKEVARELARRSGPDDRIAVIGSEPQVYFYARRPAATSYIYMYPLMEPQPFAARMQEEMIAQLEREPPRFLVLVNVDTSWSRRPGSSLRILDWAAATVDADYRQIGLVEMSPDEPSRSVWGEDALTATPRTRAFVAVFEREARADAGGKDRGEATR